MTGVNDTLFRRLMANSASRGDGVAIRQKRFGIWHATTWRDWARRVRECALGLRDDGLRPGDHVAIVAESREEWLLAQLGVALAGGIPVAPHVGAAFDMLAQQIVATGCVMAICEGQEQVDNMLLVRNQSPTLRRILTIEGRGLRDYEVAGLGDFTSVVERGAAILAADPAAAEALVDQCAADALLLVSFTAGTTGAPKPVRQTHAAALAAADALAALASLRTEAEIVSVLPLGHATEQAISLHLATTIGACVNFAESPRTMQDDIREIAPDVFVAPPRVWEGLHTQITVKIERSGPLRRNLLGRAFRRSSATPQTSSSWAARIWLAAYDLLVFRPLRDYLGLSRGGLLACTGGMPALESLRFFRRLGLPVRNLYSVAEAGGVVAWPNSEQDPAIVGHPLPLLGGKVDLEGTFQIGLSGAWFDSGDLAELEPAGLRIDGHSADAAGGAAIEAMLRASPYINQAMLTSDATGRPVLLAQVDAGAVGAWAEARRLPYTTYRSLTEAPAVRDLVAGLVGGVNADLAAERRISALALLPEMLEAAHGELTPIMTIRRHVVAQRHAALINSATAL